MQTIQQKLAIKAHRNIQDVAQEDQQKYGSMAHKLPILVRTAGLVQALGFVQARGNDAQKMLLNHIADAIDISDVADGPSLLEKSRDAQLEEYIFLTKRVMMALVWYKRFVESEFDISARDATNETEPSRLNTN